MTLLADVRFGLRLLARNPAFALSVALALGLGIGVNAMAFTIYNAALFKALPFDDPSRVVHVDIRNPREGWDRRVQYDEFLEYERQSRTCTALAAYMGDSTAISGDGAGPQRVDGEIVTANLFALLGQRPALGRDFRADDARPDAERVAIVSYGLWQARYAGDARVVGRRLTLNGKPHTVVGVMPPRMEFPFASKIWTLLIDTPDNHLTVGYHNGLQVVGRLRDGVTPAQAQTELTGIGARLDPTARARGTSTVVVPFVEWDVTPRFQQLGRAMIGAVAFVLLIACANAANLLMARAVTRGREIAIRVSLGAGRARLVRQLLVESVLLGALGGVVGLAMTAALVRAFVLSIRDIGAPYWIDWSMDATSFAYVAAISLGSGLVFGLAPALQLSKVDPVRGLNESGRSAGTSRRTRSLVGALVVAEISLTLVLMVGAGLFVRSLMTLGGVDVGFRTGDLITATVPLGEQQYPRSEDRVAFVEKMTASLGADRDVAAFTFASGVPGLGRGRRYLKLADRDLADANGAYPLVADVSIAPGYFAALGLAMARGREFSLTDGGGAPNAMIVNQPFASRYWPGEDPIGKRLRLGGDDAWSTVVGVSPPIRQTTLHRDVEPLVYQPARQGWPFWFAVMARARSTPEAAVKALRAAAHAADPNLELLNVRPYGEILDRLTVETRLLSAMFSMFAAIGIALSAFGIYAVTAYAASRRTQEIGVRVALGATRRDVVWLILRGGLAQLAIALPIGLAGAVAAGRALQGALFDISPLDTATFVSIPLLLAAVVVLASLVPAWRAAQLNPLDAIRE